MLLGDTANESSVPPSLPLGGRARFDALRVVSVTRDTHVDCMLLVFADNVGFRVEFLED